MGLKSLDPYYMSPLKNLSEQTWHRICLQFKEVFRVDSCPDPPHRTAQLQGPPFLGTEQFMVGRQDDDQAEMYTVAPDPRQLLWFCERLCAVIGKVLLRSASFARPSLPSPVIWKKEIMLRCRRELERLYEYITHLWDKAGAHETTGL